MNQAPYPPNPINLTSPEPTPTPLEPTTNKFRINFKARLPKKALTASTSLLIIFLVGAGFLLPKIQILRFTTRTHKTISASLTSLDSVEAPLNNLYKFATKPPSNTAVAKYQKRAATKYFVEELENWASSLSFTFQGLSIDSTGKITLGGKVAGLSTRADDQNKTYLSQRSLAEKVSSEEANSNEILSDLKTGLETTKTLRSLVNLKSDLQNLDADTEKYLSQVGKTADYYILISDLGSQLQDIFSSSQTSLYASANTNSLVASFDDTSKKLKSLRASLNDLGDDDLPQNIQDFNNSSIQAFDVVIKYLDQVKVLTLRQDPKGIVDATSKLALKLNKLTLESAAGEVSFWKNNVALNSYGSLSSEHTTLLKKLEEARDKNSFFMAKYLGGQ